MNDLGRWFDATKAHLQAHWKAHLPPLIAYFGGSIAMGIGIAGLFGCAGFATAIAASVSHSDSATALILGLAWGLAFLMLFPMILALMPLYFGYLRVALRAERGMPAEKGDLLWGFRNLGKVFGLLFLMMACTIPAALCCYFPAILVGTAFLFSFLVMVDRELGPVACLKESWALVRPRFLQILLVQFLMIAAMMVLAYVPMVGPILATMAYVAALVVIYEDLRQL